MVSILLTLGKAFAEMVKKGRKGKKEKQVPEPPPVPSADKIPRSFIFAKPGKVRREVQQLVQDFRQVMMPNTAPNLKVQILSTIFISLRVFQVTKRNVMKDFLNVAGQLGVTHLLYFTATDNGNYLRMVCCAAAMLLLHAASPTHTGAPPPRADTDVPGGVVLAHAGSHQRSGQPSRRQGRLPREPSRLYTHTSLCYGRPWGGVTLFARNLKFEFCFLVIGAMDVMGPAVGG